MKRAKNVRGRQSEPGTRTHPMRTRSRALSLLSLPSEIRSTIWNLVIDENEMKEPKYTRTRQIRTGRWIKRDLVFVPPFAGALRVNRQVNREMRQAQLRLGRFLRIRCEDYRSADHIHRWINYPPSGNPIHVHFLKAVSFPVQIKHRQYLQDELAKLRSGQLVELSNMWNRWGFYLVSVDWAFREGSEDMPESQSVVTVEKKLVAVHFDPEDEYDDTPVVDAEITIKFADRADEGELATWNRQQILRLPSSTAAD